MNTTKQTPMPQSQVISGMTTSIMSDIRKLADTAQAHALETGVMQDTLEYILEVCKTADKSPAIQEIEKLVNYALFGE